MTPLVSICITTFNQHKYISQCIDSVLNQITSFPIQICIGDDDSRDGTREICENYVQKYPDRIKLYKGNNNNKIVINGKPTGRRNFLETFKICKGKYIAMCEGDDYWSDPYKLQKQVDFLENNPYYSLCCTDYDELSIDNVLNESRLKQKFQIVSDQKISFKDYFQRRYLIRTVTILIKKEIIDSYFSEVSQSIILEGVVGDVPIWFYALLHGDAKFIATNTSVYRVTRGTASRPDSLINKYKFGKGIIFIRKYFAELKGDKELLKLVRLEHLKNELLNCYNYNNKPQAISLFIKMLFLNPKEIKNLITFFQIVFKRDLNQTYKYFNFTTF